MTNCKSRNGESGDEMRGMIGTWGIRVRTGEIRMAMHGIKVGMQGVREGMWGIRVIICEYLRVYCFG